MDLDRSRVERFLTSALASVTQERYSGALEAFSAECLREGVVFSALAVEEQDWFLADKVLEGYEAGGSRSFYATLLSALLKRDPRLQLKVAWRVLDVWAVKAPPRQAPAVPPEVLLAVVAVALLLGLEEASTAMLLAYCGLLRISEALGLRRRDVVVAKESITLCLGRTKRGLEEKVVLLHPGVRDWVVQFLDRRKLEGEERLFKCSYATLLAWLRAIAAGLGFAAWELTTHSLRRSGASELARRGVPFPDILLFGRWRSERSAREYIRRGEVAVLRARGGADPADLRRAEAWSRLAPRAWLLLDGGAGWPGLRRRQLSPALLTRWLAVLQPAKGDAAAH